MCSNVSPLLELDRTQICAQIDRTRPYAKGTLVDSRTGTWKLTPAAPRSICVTDPSECIHESVWMRLAKDGGDPDPSPYRDAAFQAFLAKNIARKEPLSSYEKDILGSLAGVPPEAILPRPHQTISLCDRIAGWLGGP